MHKPTARQPRAELQADLGFELEPVAALPAPALAAAQQDAVGLALGRDHARFHVALPAAHLHPDSPLFQGFHQTLQAGASARQREVAAGTRTWLALRLQAWTEGLPFEDLLLTPHYLRQLRREHCPVSRQALREEIGAPQQRVWARLRQDLGYSAGHLVQLGRQAAQALQGRNARQLQQIATRQAALSQSAEGLSPAEWARLAALARLVSPQDPGHDALPVLPCNRLHLLNPQQALQAWISRQLPLPGWAARGTGLHDGLRGVPARQAVRALWTALAPYALRLNQLQGVELQWALEDLWADERVQRRWVTLLQLVRADELEALLVRLPAPEGCHLEHHAEAGGLEGWAELH